MLKVDTRQTARPYTIPAPTGGLNGRDSLAAMPAQDAYLLDNWFPGTATLDSRNGFNSYFTGIGAAVESLEVYTGGAASRLLAFAGGKIFNATASGIAGTPLQSGRLSNRVVTAMFSNAGNQFLLGVSGLDRMFAYDGSTVTNMDITGLTGSQNNLSHVFAYKGRVYLAQRNQLGFYYLPVGQIQGAASYFDLSQVAKNGGYLVAMASYSMADSGTGPNEYAVFATSTGEYIVYAGFDPSNAANWQLVGRYYAAPPIGRKCFVPYESDLLVLTTEGLLPFSVILHEGEIATSDDAITAKLGSLLSDLNVNAGVHGWEALRYSRGGWLQVNVPASASIAGSYYTYVMNVKTKAWARFTNLNGICWAIYNQRLYFGTYDGRICISDDGALDDGQPIKVDSKQAYNLFDDGNGGAYANKHFHFAKLLVGSDGTPPLSAQFNVDYVENQPEYVGNPATGAEGEWDTATWDVSAWGADMYTQTFMASLGKYGQAGSLWLRGSLRGTKLKWYATQYIFTKVKGLF